MGDNNGLTVGLAVGIPTFVIIVFVGIFWLRNHRKQKREDMIEDDIDIGLKDDQSFQQFEQELHKPVHRVEESNGSSTLTDNSHQNVAPKANNKKTYDFYNTFIPVLDEPHKNDESFPDSGVDLSQASLLINPNTPNPNTHSHNSSFHLLQQPTPATVNDKSLDSLAKHLSTPQFFEKLPSKTQALNVKVKHNNSNNLPNNSSSDILQNNLVGESLGLNESYAYTANAIDTRSATPPRKLLDIKSSNVHDIHSKLLNTDDQPVDFEDSPDFVSLPPSPKAAGSVLTTFSSPFEDKHVLLDPEINRKP